MDMKKKESVLRILAVRLKRETAIEKVDFDRLEEIRIREGCPVIYYENGREYLTECMADRKMLMEEMEYITSYSLYAYENEMRQGFVTVQGGHRIGICGKVIYENGRLRNIQYVSSINIRVSHEVKGCADPLFPAILEGGEPVHTLIISPPGRGKTTLLRDMIRQISNGSRFMEGRTVGVVDERSEVGACYMGHPCNELGIRTDIMDGCAKTEGMMMVIRSMGPQVLAVDEIGGKEEMDCIAGAMRSGIVVIATAHGSSPEEIRQQSHFKQVTRDEMFKRYIVMRRDGKKGEIEGIYNEQGMRV